MHPIIQAITTSRELEGESLSPFISYMNHCIVELFHSSDNNEKLGGVMAIGINSYTL
jgi:hypothetical protein